MPPKSRASKRKDFFRTHVQQELTGHETAAALHCYENEDTGGSRQYKKRRRGNQDNPDYIDICGMNDLAVIPPKFRTSKGKAILRTPEHAQQELIGHETAAVSQYYENEDTSGFRQSKKKCRSNKDNPDCVDMCGGNESIPVTSSTSYGQALYQRSCQGLVVEYKDSGDSSFQCNHCGAYFWIGEALISSVRTNNNAPIYSGCCLKGEFQIPLSDSTPPFLQQLLDPNNGRQSLLFRENIRVYNSMFCFTSMGAKIESDMNKRSGPYVFKICGQIHQMMGSALPSEGESPKYAQLYIYDTRNEVSNRMNAIDLCHTNENYIAHPGASRIRLSPPSILKKSKVRVKWTAEMDGCAETKHDIVEGLIKMFDEINELAKEYRNVRDKFEDGLLPSFNMTILGPQPTDSRQYELPTNDEIAGLIVGDIGEFNSNRDIIVQLNNGRLKWIFKFHSKYMSLQYPLLFPYGEDGYKYGLELRPIAKERGKKNMNLMMIKFICYQVHDRPNDSSTLLKGGRLFQQYLVDAYATVEEDRLGFVRIKAM